MKSTLSFILVFSIGTISYSQKMVEEIGHYTQLGLPLTAFGISVAKGDTEGMIQLVKSFAVQTSIIVVGKRAFNRTRPNGGRYSFPSGHTAVSFMSSTYIWKRYGWEYGLPTTAMAAFVGFSRFGTDEPVHYFSDVVVGCIVGVGSSWLFTRRHESNVKVDVTGNLSYLGVNLKINLN